MTLREVIEGVVKEWWGAPQGHAIVKSGTHGLAAKLEHAVSLWMVEQDCCLDQIIALVKADMHPCFRKRVPHLLGGKELDDPGWNLQLSPEAGHLIDYDGATLEDVLQEACAEYLSKEATT